MRNARREDYWRRVYARHYPASLASLSFKNVLGLGEGEVQFNGAITVFCGANGVGKSTLMDVVMGVLDVDGMGGRVIGKKRLRGSHLEAVLVTNGTRVEVKATYDAEGTGHANPSGDVSVTLIDPGVESARLATWYSTIAHLDELLEPLSPIEASSEELREVSELVGKDYELCHTFEIDQFGDEEIFPYFRVSSAGMTYGSETMGIGEMALFLTRWQLLRAPPKSVVLIEEPEVHVTPKSQKMLLDPGPAHTKCVHQ
jgi:hypothetical protein